MPNEYTPIPFSQIDDIACDMRCDILRMVHNCGRQKGHLGGCMSAVEVLAVLYTQVMNINEVLHSGRAWSERDRFIMSKGHAGIAMYAAMKHVGLVSQEMIDGPVRGKGTALFRHPRRNTEYGIECSVGSLGMGIGYGVGLSEAFKRNGSGQNVFVMLGDGECNEGAVWESASYASHRKLDNLTVIIDRNGLQLDGRTHDVMSMDNMAERWSAFGFRTVEVNGHDTDEILEAFKTARMGRPLCIIADTVKGKGVSFAEGKTEWHDNYLDDELYERGMAEQGDRDLSVVRSNAEMRFRDRKTDDKTGDAGTDNDAGLPVSWTEDVYLRGYNGTVGFAAEVLAGRDEKFTILYADCENRLGMRKLKEKYPGKCYETGISEQNMVSMAAAMAHEGFHVFAVAYAPFVTARVLDQVRVNMGYMRAPVCLIGLSAGLAGGDLGATHTALEDIADMRAIPNVSIEAPSDKLEIASAMEKFCRHPESCYIRITDGIGSLKMHSCDENYGYDGYECVRRGGKAAFVTCGTVVADVLSAAERISEEHGINVSVYNVHTLKPFDKGLYEQLMKYEMVISVEEHNIIGGLGSILSENFAGENRHPVLRKVGIMDEYLCADTTESLKRSCGITGEGLAAYAVENLKKELRQSES